ncbi:MAG: hypothetical protein JST40_02085 [Armatimonadetes bacterium]|nr:hypothetical protein [Armatimonadota bacterium]
MRKKKRFPYLLVVFLALGVGGVAFYNISSTKASENPEIAQHAEEVEKKESSDPAEIKKQMQAQLRARSAASRAEAEANGEKVKPLVETDKPQKYRPVPNDSMTQTLR